MGEARRRGSVTSRVEASKVMSAAELNRLLDVLAENSPRYWPLLLLLADAGAPLGEAIALRCKDVDLDSGNARTSRSYSSGLRLGPTKTGHGRSSFPRA
jgi:integrase